MIVGHDAFHDAVSQTVGISLGLGGAQIGVGGQHRLPHRVLADDDAIVILPGEQKLDAFLGKPLHRLHGVVQNVADQTGQIRVPNVRQIPHRPRHDDLGVLQSAELGVDEVIQGGVVGADELTHLPHLGNEILHVIAAFLGLAAV